MNKKLLTDGLAQWNISLSQQQLNQLERFYVLVTETNKVMNLTAVTQPDEFTVKHYLDSASLLTADNFSGKKVVDVGCGAGFPGVPLKLMCPDCQITLLDSLGKRIKFLNGCIEDMQLDKIQAVHARAEEFAVKNRNKYDFAVSRAVAKLNILSELSLPMVKTGGSFIAMKSIESDEEIKQAEHGIELLGGEIEEIRDITIPNSEIVHRLVIIRKIKNTPTRYPRRFQKISASPL